MWKCWARRYRGGKFRLLRCAVRNGEDRLNFRAGMMLEGAGGLVALQTSPDGRGGYRGGKFRLLRCAVRAEADIRTSERK